ncbi:MAG TPA: glycosyltransferase, partial [Chitinophagaceae bacterium]|nr:glycosyltransferase [Chitinophagaceae bacterium]
DVILSGWHHYKLKFPAAKLKLIMLGAGEMMPQLKQYLADHGLEEDVLLPGLQPRESMPDWYAIADYYIIGSDYEGSSVSLLEAMFNQLPVIGADSPGINAMLGHAVNALLYPVRDYEKLAEQIRLLQEEPDFAARLAARAKSDYESNYSFEAMMKSYEIIFNEVNPLPMRANQIKKESLSIH